MTILYCSPRQLAFLHWRKARQLLYPDDEVHMAASDKAARGWHRDITYFVRGYRYEHLPQKMREYVEKKYKELQD